jgi:hypothetical protein
MSNPAAELQAQFEAAIGTAIGTQTDYQLGQQWAKKTGQNPLATMARASRWRTQLPKSIIDFVLLLDALGYKIKIERCDRKNGTIDE